MVDPDVGRLSRTPAVSKTAPFILQPVPAHARRRHAGRDTGGTTFEKSAAEPKASQPTSLATSRFHERFSLGNPNTPALESGLVLKCQGGSDECDEAPCVITSTGPRAAELRASVGPQLATLAEEGETMAAEVQGGWQEALTRADVTLSTGAGSVATSRRRRRSSSSSISVARSAAPGSAGPGVARSTVIELPPMTPLSPRQAAALHTPRWCCRSPQRLSVGSAPLSATLAQIGAARGNLHSPSADPTMTTTTTNTILDAALAPLSILAAAASTWVDRQGLSDGPFVEEGKHRDVDSALPRLTIAGELPHSPNGPLLHAANRANTASPSSEHAHEPAYAHPSHDPERRLRSSPSKGSSKLTGWKSFGLGLAARLSLRKSTQVKDVAPNSKADEDMRGDLAPSWVIGDGWGGKRAPDSWFPSYPAGPLSSPTRRDPIADDDPWVDCSDVASPRTGDPTSFTALAAHAGGLQGEKNDCSAAQDTSREEAPVAESTATSVTSPLPLSRLRVRFASNPTILQSVFGVRPQWHPSLEPAVPNSILCNATATPGGVPGGPQVNGAGGPSLRKLGQADNDDDDEALLVTYRRRCVEGRRSRAAAAAAAAARGDGRVDVGVGRRKGRRIACLLALVLIVLAVVVNTLVLNIKLLGIGDKKAGGSQ